VNAHTIRYWLVRRPQPTSIKVYAGEQVSELSRADGQTWADLAKTIEALDPDKIEVYNSAGKLIRATRSDDEDVEAAADGATAKPTKATYDAETERLKVVSGLIADAYKFAVGVAFEKLTDMLNSNVAQTGNLWRTLEQSNRMMARLNQDIVDQALEQAEERATNADPISGLLGQFVAGQQTGMAEAAAAAARKPNGARAPSNGKGQV
jgi:hypothetical protein